jgi:hypothetical protein
VPRKNYGTDSKSNGSLITFNKNGLPDFTPHMYKGTAGKAEVTIKYTGSRAGDEAAADLAAGFTATSPRPAGYTWHHHESVGRMQLVRSDVHNRVPHSGGVQIYKAKGGKGYVK